MSSSHGQKVTTDPETQYDPKNENPGTVTSDSLAAESINEGGSFGANSDSRGPSAQPSYSTTTNTADISNATRLDPAPDAEARLASEEWGEAQQFNAGRTLSQGQSGSSGGSAGGASYSDVTNQAPTGGYAASNDDSQPKGKNIQEGGFDSSAPNASFNNEIGGKNDPGRAALGKMEGENVPFGGGAGPREDQISGNGQYDVLKDASA